MGLKETILKSVDLEKQPVSIPSWAPDGELFVRELTAKEAEKIYGYINKKAGDYDVRAVCLGLVDKDGGQVFREEDWKELQAKSAAIVAQLAKTIMRMSGMWKDDQDDLKKTSEETTPDGSPTDSRFLSDV